MEVKMLKKLIIISLSVISVSLAFEINYVKASSIAPNTPKRIVFNYLSTIYEASRHKDLLGRIEFNRGVKVGQPLRDETLYIGGDFGDIMQNVSTQFEGKIWSFEEIIIATNKQLRDFGYDIIIDDLRDDFVDEYESYLPENVSYGNSLPLEEFLGENRSEESRLERIAIYPIADVSAKFDIPEAEEDEQEIEGWMIDWYIEKRIVGESSGDIINIINRTFDIDNDEEFMDKIDGYLGHEFTTAEAGDIYTMLYFSDIIYKLTHFTPSVLVTDGYFALIDQAEATHGKEFFKREWSDESKKMVVKVGNEKLTNEEALELVKKKMELTVGFLVPVSEYFGKKLDLSKPRDAGKVASAATEVFNRVRLLNYDPYKRKWIERDDGHYEKQFNSAKERVKKSLEYATEMRLEVEQAFGISLPIGKNGTEGEQARRFVNLWASLAVDFEEYGVSNPIRAAEELLPGTKKGDELIEKLQKLWRGVGETFNLNTDVPYKADLARRTYNGLVKLVAEILSKPDYYEIDEGDFDAAFEEAKNIIDSGIDEGLIGIISDDYLNFKLNVKSGHQMGIYTFWSQVLEVKGMNFVKKHIQVRREIVEAIQGEIGIFTLKSTDNLATLGAFENKLNPLNLEDSKNRIINAIYGEGEYSGDAPLKADFSNLNDILDKLPEVPLEDLEEFYPPIPQTGEIAEAFRDEVDGTVDDSIKQQMVLLGDENEIVRNDARDALEEVSPDDIQDENLKEVLRETLIFTDPASGLEEKIDAARALQGLADEEAAVNAVPALINGFEGHFSLVRFAGIAVVEIGGNSFEPVMNVLINQGLNNSSLSIVKKSGLAIIQIGKDYPELVEEIKLRLQKSGTEERIVNMIIPKLPISQPDNTTSQWIPDSDNTGFAVTPIDEKVGFWGWSL